MKLSESELDLILTQLPPEQKNARYGNSRLGLFYVKKSVNAFKRIESN